MATYQSLSLLCLFSFSLLLFFNPANCQMEEKEDGPWGGIDNRDVLTWRFTLGDNETIQSLIVKAADIVDAIGFTIKDDATGNIVTKIYGNIAGGSLREVQFAEGETIVKIYGKHSEYRRNEFRTTISELRITTNLNTQGYGPFGKGAGRNVVEFQSPLINSGTFVGLFGNIGNSTRFVESIGLISAH